MRTIRFRGKNYNTWVEGFYCELDSASGRLPYIIVPKQGADDHDQIYAVKPDSVGQYAGFEDMNGKPVYEGDIVKYHTPPTPWAHHLEEGTVGEVRVSASAFYLAVRRSAAMTDLYILNSFFSAHGAAIEVVGNIYEQKEENDKCNT